MGLVFSVRRLGMTLCKPAERISCGKQYETKNSTPEIKVVSDAIRLTPLHPGKQVKCFKYMSKNDYY
jgi:hypothetical protein